MLHKAGWPVTTINLEPPRISMDDFADQLSKRIREVLDETGAERLILESVCWILLAAVAHWKWGWSAYAAIGGMVAGIVGLRVALVATTFAIAIAHSPELPPGLRVSLIGGGQRPPRIDQSRSMTPAMPCPPPMHMVTRP